MKCIEKIQKFMYGRYGVDDLYRFLFKLYILLLIIDLIFKVSFIKYIELFIIVVMFYRVLSKNIYRRSDENIMFLKIKRKVLKPFDRLKKWIYRIIDKNYIYKKCRKCKTVIRLPLPDKIGIKSVKCPNCKKRNKVFCFKKEKIEVIKKEKVRRK